MRIDIQDIKSVRNKIGLTQKELALKSGVSQSLIAKIEAGTIDPTFSKAKRIIECLSSINRKSEIRAKDIMKPKIISVDSSDKIKKVITKMKKHGISQMPVVDKVKIIGSVSESTILDALISGKQDLMSSDVMESEPPTVPKDAPLDTISSLLKFYSLVLVADKGKTLGIITKSDVIEKAYK